MFVPPNTSWEKAFRGSFDIFRPKVFRNFGRLGCCRFTCWHTPLHWGINSYGPADAYDGFGSRSTKDFKSGCLLGTGLDPLQGGILPKKNTGGHVKSWKRGLNLIDMFFNECWKHSNSNSRKKLFFLDLLKVTFLLFTMGFITIKPPFWENMFGTFSEHQANPSFR